jgi:hypothetical protein
MQINKIMGVIFSVIVVVVGLVMLPLILTQTNTATSNAYIASFPGTSSIVELIPLLYSVGVLGLAGGVAFFTLKSAGKGN